MRKVVVFIGLVVFVVASVSAQTTADRPPRTIEDLYLSQDIELQIIRSQALSSDREMKMLALQSIRAMIDDGSIDRDNPGMLIVLEALATEGTMRQVRSGNTVMNNFPDVRRMAANLLGEVGGERAKVALMSVVAEDNEPMVLAEAVYALGVIGMNDNNEVTAQIVRMLQFQNARTLPDNNLAYAALLSLEKIAGATGGIRDPEVVNVLLDVAGGPYIRSVRLKAIDVIYALRGR